MKKFLLFLPSILSYFILAAHYSRQGLPALIFIFALFPLLLFFNSKTWPFHIYKMGLIFSVIEWSRTIMALSQLRLELGQPWIRMAIILSSVILLNFLSLWLLYKKKSRLENPDRAAVISFCLTFLLLLIIQIQVPFPIILMERFFSGFGLIEIVLFSFYSAYITHSFLTTKNRSKLRIRIWSLFAIVFFLQLFLGLIGFEQFLQTGKLHFPIPALIMGGPLFRGQSFFMPLLFLSTIILVGPSWCSHLCYVGALDQKLAEKKKYSERKPLWNNQFRYFIFLAVILFALIFRYLSIPISLIITIVSLFGIGSLFIMFRYSKKSGQMIHCSRFCPIGILSTRLGRINPFRIKIKESKCDQCFKCSLHCRYNALLKEDIMNYSPNINCTLCGDCLESCAAGALNFHLGKSSPQTSMTIFYILICSFHAIFMAVARI